MYGSSDYGVVFDNDKLPFIFSKFNKTNLKIKVYNNLDHNFFEKKINIPFDENKFYWQNVFDDVMQWFSLKK